jgi:hypothetical protein
MFEKAEFQFGDWEKDARSLFKPVSLCLSL